MAAAGPEKLDPARTLEWLETFLASYRSSLWLASGLALLGAGVAYSRRQAPAATPAPAPGSR
jgi:hypothetical protein